MATSRQFAYNNSDLIPGTIQVGDLSVGVPTSGFTSSPQFWSGPDEELGYVIASPTSGNTQPTPIFIEAPSGQMNCSTIYKGTDIQLSNNNQTAYQAFGYQMSVLTNTFIDKNDRVMFSVLSTTLQPLTLPQSRFVGVGKTTMNYQGDPYGGYPGNDTQSIGINAIGEYYYNGSVVQSGLPTWASGDIVDIAISHGQWWWIRVNGGDWNNNPVANPETNTSGLLMNGLVNCYPVLCPGYEGTMTIQNTATYGTPVGFTLFGVNENASVYFNRTKTLTEEAFIDLSEYVSNKNGTPQTFTTGNQASAWLTNNGFWNSWVGVSNNIIIEGVYYPGSVNASYTATASYPLDVDMKVNFQNTLGTISGSPLVLSGSVEILAGSTTGYEQLTVDYNYNNLTDESSFGNVSFDITGTTEYGFTVEASSGTTFDVTPTPTPSVTPPVTPSVTTPYVHYDATVASSLTVVGSNVTQWNDISGNGYNLTIGAGTGPTISAIGPNRALFFNRTKLIRNLVPLTTEVTVLMSLIYSPSGSIGSWGNFMHHGDHDYDWSIRRNYNSNFIQMHTDNNNDSALNVPVSNNNIYVMVGRITQSGGSTNLVESWLYNKTGASNSTSNIIPKSIVAGNKTLYVGGSDVNEYSNSVIGEIMYYNSSLSNSDLQTAVTYMKDKWFATGPTPTPTPTVTQTPTVTVTPTNTVTPTKTSVTPTPTSTLGAGPTPVLDLDAANYSALPVNGSTVAGTGGYTVTMTNANSSMSWNSSNGGIFRKSTGNGTDQLIVSGINYSSGTQPYTVFMAYKASPTVPGRILGANSANPDWNLGTYYAYKNEYYPGGPVNFLNDATDTAWNFIWGIGNGTNLSQLYIATSTAPTAVYKTANFVGGFNGLRLFGRYQNATTSNELQTGDIGFVKVYNSVLTLSQIQTLHSTYKTRFGY
jgi:hypothetical protein